MSNKLPKPDLSISLNGVKSVKATGFVDEAKRTVVVVIRFQVRFDTSWGIYKEVIEVRGKAVAQPEDIFDPEFGLSLATAKAEIKMMKKLIMFEEKRRELIFEKLAESHATSLSLETALDDALAEYDSLIEELDD